MMPLTSAAAASTNSEEEEAESALSFPKSVVESEKRRHMTQWPVMARLILTKLLKKILIQGLYLIERKRETNFRDQITRGALSKDDDE